MCRVRKLRRERSCARANLFDNPIDAFAPPHALPAIPISLFIPMGKIIFIPCRTAGNAIAGRCFCVQNPIEERHFGSVRELLGWSLTDCGTATSASALNSFHPSKSTRTYRVTAVQALAGWMNFMEGNFLPRCSRRYLLLPNPPVKIIACIQ